MISKIKVSTQDKRSYFINWNERNDLIKAIHAKIQKGDIVITNTKIKKLYKDFLKISFGETPIIVIKDGEETKSLKIIQKISEKLIKLGADRKTRLWGFGGGVIGDITGFTAATFMRGINFYQLPTTLLAMVDSSVGGKNAVNLHIGKNLIGTFYHPQEVFIGLFFINTLKTKEIRSGLAEVVKSALLFSFKFVKILEENVSKIINQDLNIWKLISKKTVIIKRTIVQKDEFEKNTRAKLNLGHTLAHAIESNLGYKKLTHGEAVSIGLGFTIFFSWKTARLTIEERNQALNLLNKLKLPFLYKDIIGNPNPKKLLLKMKMDKKKEAGKIRFIFLEKLGSATLPIAVDENDILDNLKEFRKFTYAD